MPETLQVGTILMKEWRGMPKLPEFETEPCIGAWSLVKMLDSFALDRKIHTAGWNFFFMAVETKVMFLGFLAPKKLKSALKRILVKVDLEHFNSLEITKIVPRRFLGVPYVTVSAHSRHMQESCTLDSTQARRAFQNDTAWTKN
jgi:hypothetical protein